MLKLTNLADYAIVLVCQIIESDARLSCAVDLAEKTNIPLPTVSKIMGALTRKGIVTSQRGLKGGFYLSQKTEKISLADIIEALEGPIGLTNCSQSKGDNCSIKDTCKLNGRWNSVDYAIRDTLANISLDQFSGQPVDHV